MEIDPLPKIRDVLGRLIRNAGYVILINQHRGRAIHGGRDFLDVDHRAIGDPPDGVQPCSALKFNLVRIFRLAAKHGVAGKPQTNGAESNGVKTKRNHL